MASPDRTKAIFAGYLKEGILWPPGKPQTGEIKESAQMQKNIRLYGKFLF